MARVFFDTNVFIYAYDTRDSTKHDQAIETISKSLREDDCFVSSQVINEFCNVMLKQNVTTEELINTITWALKPHVGKPSDVEIVDRALLLFSKSSLSYYDSLIIQAAIDQNCSIIYSEDLQDGQRFGKLQVINPFR